MKRTNHVKTAGMRFSVSATNILVLVVIFAILYGVVPKLVGRGSAWQAMSRLNISWLGLAIACLLMTYGLATCLYMILSPRRLEPGPTYLAQAAGSFAGRILPAGLGALGVGFLYLRKSGCSAGQAAIIVSVNNVLGFVGNAILLAGFLPLLPGVHLHFGWPISDRLTVVATLTLVIVLVAALWLARKRGMWRRVGSGLHQQVLTYRRQPARLAAALIISMLLTMVYSLMLYFAGRAVGVNLTLGLSLLAMTAGVAVGTGTPTPGGLGGVEAGIALSLTAGGFSSAQALAAALTYRLVSYWLAIIIGLPAFVVARYKSYF